MNQQPIDLNTLSIEQLQTLAGNVAITINNHQLILNKIAQVFNERMHQQTQQPFEGASPIVLPKLKKLNIPKTGGLDQ